MNTVKIREALSWGRSELKGAEIDDYKKDSEILLTYAIGKNQEYCFSNPDYALSQDELLKFHNWIGERKQHKPTFQIIGALNVNGVNLEINGSVLIPRQETEILVESALEYLDSYESRAIKVLDMGTGSGYIVLSLASANEIHKFYASDVSPKALKTAIQNSKNNNLDSRIIFKEGDMFDPWGKDEFDFIIANLPYVPEGRMGMLSREVVEYEPHEAIFSGLDGLDTYRKFFEKAPQHLGKNGLIMTEIDETQASAVKNLVKKYLPSHKCKIIKDLAGFDRIAIIKKEFNKEEK